jgi:hypothetical protein
MVEERQMMKRMTATMTTMIVSPFLFLCFAENISGEKTRRKKNAETQSKKRWSDV